MSARREYLRERIEEIAALKPGRYGPNDGDPIAPETLAFAREWVETESEEELAKWGVYALDDGGLGFERLRPLDRNDEIFVLADRIEYGFVQSESRYPWRTLWSAWVTVDREPPHTLRELDAEDW